jgi:hypothetical protein
MNMPAQSDGRNPLDGSAVSGRFDNRTISGIPFAGIRTYRLRARGAFTNMPDRLAFRAAFKTSADDGAAYLIDVFEIMHDGPDGEICGALLYRTADGEAVKRLESGVYEIEESGLIVRSTWLAS